MNNQQQQEERQQKILEALDYIKLALERLEFSGRPLMSRCAISELDLLASECGVGDIWRK